MAERKRFLKMKGRNCAAGVSLTENQKTIRNYKKELFQRLMWATAAVAAVAIASLGWYVSNSEVSASMTSISSAEAGPVYELGLASGYNLFSYWVQFGKHDLTVPPAQSWTDENNPEIMWGLSSSDPMDGVISPGDSGELHFRVKTLEPLQPLKLDISLDIASYGKVLEAGGWSSTPWVDPAAPDEGKYIYPVEYDKLAKGHILFFGHRTTDSSGRYVYSEWLNDVSSDDGVSTTVTLSGKWEYDKDDKKWHAFGVKKPSTLDYRCYTMGGGQTCVYEVTIYWVWPYSLDNIILGDTTGNLVISDNDEDKIRKEITDAMVESDTIEKKDFETEVEEEKIEEEKKYFNDKKYGVHYFLNSDYHFYKSDNMSKLPVFAKDGLQSRDDLVRYTKFSEAYNEADQYIGKNAKYLLVSMKTNLSTR